MAEDGATRYFASCFVRLNTLVMLRRPEIVGAFPAINQRRYQVLELMVETRQRLYTHYRRAAEQTPGVDVETQENFDHFLPARVLLAMGPEGNDPLIEAAAQQVHANLADHFGANVDR